MKVTSVLLAAGQGTRMKTLLPKVLHPVCGKPMLAYALESACSVSTELPVVIVGKDAQALNDYLGDTARCIVQEPPLGTGHAVQQAETSLRGKTDLVLVTYSDMPLLTHENSIQAGGDPEEKPRPYDHADGHRSGPTQGLGASSAVRKGTFRLLLKRPPQLLSSYPSGS